MISVNRTFSPVKLTLQDPQDVEDLRKAILDSIYKLEYRYLGLLNNHRSLKENEYYNRISFLLKKLNEISTQTAFRD